MTDSSSSSATTYEPRFKVAHLTTVDLSLRFLVRPQLLAVVEAGGEAVGVSAPGPWVADLERDGVRHVALTASTRGMSLVSDLRAAVQFWRVLRRERFTVLHTHNPKPGLYGRVMGRLAGVPLVVNTLHGMYATEEDGLLKRGVVYLLETMASRFSDFELHQNPEDLELSFRLKIIRRGRGRLLGNGVDLERFDPSTVDPAVRTRIRTELGIADAQVLVGMVGRLVLEKGYSELFEAAADLDDQFVFVVIGPEDPQKSDALSAEAIADARSRGVRFVGMRTDMADLYKAMDMFALPSHREGFPRAAMEAASMGLPLVATNIRGCRQVVDDGINGFLVPVKDPIKLAESIRRIGEDASLRTAMGEASRRIALERFDELEVVRIVMDTYRNGLIAKGLGHLLPSGLVGDAGSTTIRKATTEDVRALANMHSEHIAAGFLPRLGRPFMKVLYRALVGWPDAVVLVAEDSAGPVGFVAGVVDVSSFYRHFAKRHGWRAGIASLPRLVIPRVFRRAWETLRYGGGQKGVPAELLAMVVAPRARGQRLSQTLGNLLLDELGQRVETVKVVVGKGNEVAIGAYRKLGFVDAGRVEVHAGEDSEVLVWHR